MKNKKTEKALLKLDFGCGPNPREGFDGVDIIKFNDKVKYVVDLMAKNVQGSYDPWPWADNSVEEVHASHIVEHFDAMERCHFVNELYRVLIVGGKATLITPHWCSCRAYGDPTHKWPPISEFWFYYLSKEWRLGDTAKKCSCNNNKDCQQCGGKGTFVLGANAPHTDIKYIPGGFNCDFEATWGYTMHPTLLVKNQEMQQFALQNYKESCQDTLATLVKRA